MFIFFENFPPENVVPYLTLLIRNFLLTILFRIVYLALKNINKQVELIYDTEFLD